MLGTLLVCASLLAVDGDTIKCNGENMRDMGDGAPFVSGYDTPEISKPRCDAELALGQRAKARMTELLATPGVTVRDSGKRDSTKKHRRLVWVYLPSGESIGHRMLQEGLARVWLPNTQANWCGSTTASASQMPLIASNNRRYITGPKGGCYYIKPNGKKAYVDHAYCGR